MITELLMMYRLYNSLPLVEHAAVAAESMVSLRAELSAIITKHGLADVFAIRLIHKHFDMEPGEVAAFRNIPVPGICDAIVMGPLKQSHNVRLLGKNFVVSPQGKLVAYEFTTSVSAGGHVSLFPEFVEEFAKLVSETGVANTFSLSWEPSAKDEHYTEFEWPEKRSTIMVPTRFFPADGSEQVILTNWFPTVSVSGEDGDHCIRTRSGKHSTCTRTRSSRHYTVGRLFEKIKEAQLNVTEPVVLLDNDPFSTSLADPTSTFFNIMRCVTSAA